jgi:hypothetical protein
MVVKPQTFFGFRKPEARHCVRERGGASKGIELAIG